MNKRYFRGMTNVAREFVKKNKKFIVCEPSGKFLDDLEAERRSPLRMKLVE
ncbi:MAG: hypothetical protein KAJ69_04570 [Thermoplasmatales archaeon]|nr:hypothetical protein [Thermoplasmatales archaeon]